MHTVYRRFRLHVELYIFLLLTLLKQSLSKYCGRCANAIEKDQVVSMTDRLPDKKITDR